MKYYIIAGEASGDLHGGNLIKALKSNDGNAQFRCWGGDYMQETSGSELVRHYKDTAYMGIIEVIKHLPSIFRNLKACKEDILRFNPDVVILIDYPGFNLRIAQFLKKKGVKVFYYISPQVWAWHASRVPMMKKNIDELFVILPFEQDFFARYDWSVSYFGHPLLDAIDNETKQENNSSDMQDLLHETGKPIIALLPGSRKQEVKRILPQMLTVQASFPDFQLVVAGVPSLPSSLYESVLQGTPVPIVYGQTHQLLRRARAALVASGTATLETALLNVPQVVCYRANPISIAIARKLVKVPYISLVNLIAGKEVVKELIQQAFNSVNLEKELRPLLTEGSPKRTEMLREYELLRRQLGGSGVSERVAANMITLLKAGNHL